MKPSNLSPFEKIKILIWKNFCVVLNNKIHLLTTFFLPLVCSLFIIFTRVRTDITPIKMENPTTYGLNFEIDLVGFNLLRYNLRTKNFSSVYQPLPSILYASSVDGTLEEFKEYMTKQVIFSNILELPDCKAVREIMQKDHHLAGICIKSDFPKFEYELVFPSELRAGVLDRFSFYQNWHTLMDWEPLSMIEEELDYEMTDHEVLLGLGILVSDFFIRRHSKTLVISDFIQIMRVPFIPSQSDKMSLWNGKDLLILLMYIYTVPSLSIHNLIIKEKENGVRTYLKIKGFSGPLQNFCWAIILFTADLLISAVVVLVLKIRWNDDGSVLSNSNISLIYLYLACFSWAEAMFCIMLVGLSDRRKSAMPILCYALSIVFCLYGLEEPSKEGYYNVSYTTKFLNHYWTLQTFFVFVGVSEMYYRGFKWSNANYDVWPKEVAVAFFLNSAIYYIIGLIFEDVVPGKHGIRFELWKKLWMKLKKKRRKFSFADYYENQMITTTSYDRSTALFRTERDIIDINATHLCKTIGDTVLLDDIKFSILQNEIVVLLGANGSGKSLLCKILGGFEPPTSGNVFLNGIRMQQYEQMEALEDVGLAFGNDFLIEDLTVNQQIMFHAAVKGKFGDYQLKEIFWIFRDDLGLQNFGNKLTRNLSLAIKDKLAIVCAFSGESRIVILDNVDTYIDTTSRNQLINSFQTWKENCTIFLTTYSVHLSSLLGDRILILDKGKLIAAGPLSQLKGLIDISYHLTLTKRRSFQQDHEKRIMKAIRKHFDDIHLVDFSSRSSILLRLPLEEDSNIYFFLNRIERSMLYYGIMNISIHQTRLYDVFEDLTKFKDDGPPIQNLEDIIRDYVYGKMHGPDLFTSYKSPTGVKGFWRRVWAMIKMHIWANKGLPYLISYFFLTLAVTWCVLFRDHANFISSCKNVPRVMDVSSYNDPKLFASVQHNDKIYAPNILVANTFWYYREAAYNNKYELVDTYGMSVIDHIVMQAASRERLLHMRYLGGIEKTFVETSKGGHVGLICYFSSFRRFSAYSNLNFLLNALVKASFGVGYSIKATFIPLPFEKNIDMARYAKEKHLTLYLGVMMYVLMVYPLFRFYDNEEDVKLMNTQKMNQSKGVDYWVSAFICLLPQLIAMLVLCLIVLNLISQFPLSAEKTFATIIGVTICLLYCRIYRLFFDYCIRNEFLATAIVYYLTVFTYIQLTDTYTEFPYGVLWYFAPLKILLDVLDQIHSNTEKKGFCSCRHIYEKSVSEGSCNYDPNCCGDQYDVWKSLRWRLLAVLFMILVFAALIAIVNTWTCIRQQFHFLKSKIRRPMKQNRSEISTPRQSDQNTNSLDKQKAIVFESVTKKVKNIVIIDDQSLKIEKGAIFVLTGNENIVTSTFLKLIARVVLPDSGRIMEFGDSTSYMRKSSVTINYCPDYTYLPLNCKVGEFLRNYAELIGTPKDVAERRCVYFAKSLSIYSEYNKNLEHCNYGTRRRISFIMALLGSPKIVLLDLPMEGVDFNGYMQMIELLQMFVSHGGTLVLVSTKLSMYLEFYESFAILKNGRFCFVGETEDTIQHNVGYLLKTKLKFGLYGNRFKANMRLNHISYTRYTNFIETTFVGAIERFHVNQFISHFIPASGSSFSEIFQKISGNLSALNIEEFSLYTNTSEILFEDSTVLDGRRT